MNLGPRVHSLSIVEKAFYAELGRKLVGKRKQRGLLQQAVAKEIGVHRNTLCRWELGEMAIPLWMLLRLCDVLCCNHLLMLPDREYTWGSEYPAIKQERDGWRRAVQAERDKPIGEREERLLRRSA